MSDCNNCFHFREERSMRNSLGLPRSMGIQQALSQLGQHEQAFKSAEAQERTRAMNPRNNEKRWSHKPKISSYCGFREIRNEYFFHQVKNKNGNCSDFLDRELVPTQSCNTCKSCVKAQGYQQQTIDIREILNQGTIVGGIGDQMRSDSNRITNDLDTILKINQNFESAEITEAMNNGGRLSSKPRFFDQCQQYSTNGEFALCKFENHDGKCHSWEPKQ